MPRAPRQEFSKHTKLQAWRRAEGRCECGCGLKIIGTPEYHHIIPAAIGGDASLENCRVFDPKCHRRQTSETDIPEISRTRRLEEKRIGVRPKKGRGFRKPPPNYDPWTRTMRDD